MSWRSTRDGAGGFVRTAAGLAFLLVASPVLGQSGPFDGLAGSWSGTGTVKLTEGGRQRIRCKSAYQLPDRTALALRLTCASDTYKITLIGTMEYRDGAVTGSWSEETRKVEGKFSGRLNGNQMILNTSGVIAATLTVTTTGPRQTVLLQLQGAKVNNVSITMAREETPEKPAANVKPVSD
jgi:hypothetical protein